MMRKWLPPLLALGLVVGILWGWTDGFRTFTVFSHALYAAGPLPRQFPDLPLNDQDGRGFRVGDGKKFVLVNFVYLDCPDVCHKITNRLEGIHRALEGRVIPNKLELVTVSFDLRQDDLRKIRSYRRHFGGGLEGWSFALPHGLTQGEFDRVLEELGLWARRIPGTHLINHAIYQFLVAPDGRIVRVFDPAREDDRRITEELELWVQK